MRKAQNCGQLLKVTNPAKLTKSNELFQKRPNTDEKTGGVEDMDCPGLLKRQHVEIPEEKNNN